MRVSIILIRLGLMLGAVLIAGAVQAQTDPGCGDMNDDGSFDILDSVVLRRALAGLGPGITQDCGGKLPATGQITCWDTSGSVVSCAGTGHDGDIQAGVPLAYMDNGDGTMTDLNTGLMWEKKSNDGSIHDKDNLYNWADTFAVHVAGLNTASFAGYTDWRVPNVKELQSIVDYETSFPSVDPVFNSGCVAACTVTTCSCTVPDHYWSSTSSAFIPSVAWGVFFASGFQGGIGKGGFNFARAVRGSL